MNKGKPHGLSRREREIMDILHRLGSAAPSQVRDELPNPPSYTAVNTMLRILMDNGQIERRQDGRQFVYFPTQPRQSAAKSALQQVIQTFFGGSVEQVVTTLLDGDETHLSTTELDRLAGLIDEARSQATDEGRGQK